MGVLFTAGPVLAEKEVRSAKPTAVPGFLMVPHTASESELLWRDGQSLTGEPDGVENDLLIWKSALFQEALQVRRDALDRIRLATPRTEPAAGFRLILTDGSCVSGEPESATADTLTFRLVHGGRVTFLQDRISRLDRLKGDGVLEAGPQVFLRKPSQDSNQDRPPPWYFSAGGEVVSPGFHQSAHFPLSLPSRCVAEVVVHGESALRFSFSLVEGVESCAVETWGDELVLTDGNDFVSAGPALKPEDRRVHLRLAWDRTTGQRVLYQADGKVLAELTVAPAAPKDGAKATEGAAKPAPRAPGGLLGVMLQLIKPRTVVQVTDDSQQERAGKGITFQNRAAGVRIESFRLTEWNGQLLPPVEAAAPAVETAEGWNPGTLQDIREGKAIFRNPDGSAREVALEKIRGINWNRLPSLEKDADLTNLWYADGDLLRGRLLPGGEGALSMATAAAREPVGAPLTGAREVVFAKPAAPPAALVPPAGDAVLTAGKASLRGRIIVPVTGILPKFQPGGVVAPVAPVKTDGLKLTWDALPAGQTVPRPQALLHLEGNQSLPVSLISISPKSVEFDWSATGPGQLETSRITSVQFPPGDPGKIDFDSPSWVLTGKAGRPQSRDGVITLEPGTSASNPYAMTGSMMGFKLSRKSGLAVIRIRLFGQGSGSAPMNFLVGDFGSSVYSGLEREEGQINSSEQINSDGKPVDIRLDASDGKRVKLIINGQVSCETPLRRQKGTSVVIESASLWGNKEGTCSISGFQSGAARFASPAPNFSEDAKREALLVPRARRDDPPRQVLVGLNGDLLRGEIESLTSTHLSFRSGMESFKVPLDRLTAAIWVKPLPPTPSPEAKPEPKKEDPAPPVPEELEWLELFNGGLIGLKIASWEPDAVVGTHPLLGACRIPLTQVSSLMLSKPDPSPGHAALSGWEIGRAHV